MIDRFEPRLRIRPVLLLVAAFASLFPAGPAPAELLIGRLREVKIRYTGGCINQPDTTFTQTVSSSASGSDTKTVSCYGSSGTLTVAWSLPETTPTAEAFGSFSPPLSFTITSTGSWTTPPPPFHGPPYSLTLTASNNSTCLDRKESLSLPAGTHTLTATKSCSITSVPSGAGAFALTRLQSGFSAGSSWGFISGTGEATYDFTVPATGSDLEVRIANEPVVTDRDAPFTVTVRNLGPETATGVRLVVDPGCNRVNSYAADACPSFAPVLCAPSACAIPSLPAGATASVSLQLRGPYSWGPVRLSASASAATSDPSPSNDRADAVTEISRCGDTILACVFHAITCAPRRPARSALAAAAVDFFSLYRLRDEVLAKTAAGRRYTELYYAHTAEVAALLATSSSLRTRFGDTYALWTDNVSKLVAGQGSSALLTQAQVDGLTGFIDQLETLASPELRAVLAREQAALNLPALVGKSLDQALAQQQSTAPATVTIPAAASIHGVGSSFFHSDLRVLNPSTDASVTVTARYRCFTGPCPSSLEKSFTVAPRELKVHDDVVGALFAAPETAGAIELVGAVLAESRVYTPSRPAATTGSDVPGLSADEATSESVLLSLSRSGFRTNVGIYNPGGDALSASIDVYRPDGVKLGTATRTVDARTAIQVNDVFGAAGIAEEPADAYAIVKADGIRELFAYATVIDNQSQDSVFIKGRNAKGAEPFFTTIPAAASIHGVPPAFFHSDVRLFNPAGGVARNVTVVYRCFTGPCPPLGPKTLVVKPGEMVVLDDIVANLFQAPETAGAIDVAGAVLVDSRVYTPTRPAPTTGTGIPGQSDATATVEAALLSLSHSADGAKGFRTNVGVFNPSSTELSVTISLRRPDGTELARLTRTVPPQSATQVNNVFVAAGIASDVPASYALVSGDGLRGFVAYATVIDNQSQDSVYVKGRPLRAP